jgi:site-specific DNA-methyltransferase (adenine-specific)
MGDNVMLNTIFNEDCLEGMKRIPDKSIDMILCDLPYGTTACKWDTIIPFEKLWDQYERIIKDNGAIVLTASQPFTSALIMSNPKLFKTEWIWEKDNPSNFVQAKNHPMKYHENILVFGKKKINYFPIMADVGKPSNAGGKNTPRTKKGGFLPNEVKNIGSNKTNLRYPKSIQRFSKPKHNSKEGLIHPTQKPVALFEYLIKTYTIERETVLDNCIGSGTTAIACINTNRNYIGFEMDKTYYDLSP